MSLNKALIAELQHEAVSTKKMLERVPAEHLGWKPHEKSMTLGRLASHVAELPHWITRALSGTEFDISTLGAPNQLASAEEMVTFHQQRIEDAVKALEAASDEALGEIWTLKRGDDTVFALPRKVVIRHMAMNHMVHHRGQLSVYLRLLNIPLPGMYGPSADEK